MFSLSAKYYEMMTLVAPSARHCDEPTTEGVKQSYCRMELIKKNICGNADLIALFHG